MQSNLNKEDDNSTVLNLEVLKKEYDATLIKYNQAQTDYASSTTDTNSFTDIKGKTYLGTGVLSEDWATSSLDDCKEACASNSKCTGATYNLDKTYCSLRTGESSVSEGSENDYAIMSKKTKQLKVLSALSDRLLEINSQILQIVKQGKPELVEMQQEKELQVSSLAKNYSDLTTQRESLDETIRETQKLNTAENQSQILITQNYSTYIVLMVLTIFVGVGIVMFSSLGKGKSSEEPKPEVAPAPEIKEEAEAEEVEAEEVEAEEVEEEAEEPEEKENPQEGGGHVIKPKYRYAILVVVSVFMVILTWQLAASCCDYYANK